MRYLTIIAALYLYPSILLAAPKSSSPVKASKQTTKRPTPPSTTKLPASTKPKPVETRKAGLTPGQIEATKRALKELRKIDAAVSVGLTRDKYSERLIDVKAAVDEELEVLPQGQIKQSLKSILDTYQDANELWGYSIDSRWVSVYMIGAKPVLDKYKINVPKVIEDEDGLTPELSSPLVRFDYVDAPLNELWRRARLEITSISAAIR